MNEKFKELRKRTLIKTHGVNNIPHNVPCIFCANHTCLMDIFYLPSVLSDNSVSLISPRLIYKNVYPRKEVVENLLVSMPIEAHGGREYARLCIEYASRLISNNFNVVIFPEGAYIEPSNNIYKGRTGAARILINSVFKYDVLPCLIPVGINVSQKNLNLDTYIPDGSTVDIYFQPPIIIEELLEKYKSASIVSEKNIVLHEIVDNCMRSIASVLNRNYIDKYIPLTPKGNVIFKDGSTVDTQNAQEKFYIDKYELELKERYEMILKLF